MGTQMDIPLIVPDKGAITRLLHVLCGERPQIVASWAAPPPDELAALSDILNGLAEHLLNDTWFSVESFNGTYAATHLEVGRGHRLQLVSFSAACSAESGVDKWLQDSTSWGDRALAIGGLIDYSGSALVSSAVLLRRQDDNLYYELVGELKDSGHWSLLRLRKAVTQPYSFFASQWLGFSQFAMQATLHHRVPTDEKTIAVARAAFDALLQSGLLPPDANVGIEKARASIAGECRVPSKCSQSDDLPNLEANLVLAAAAQCLEKEIGSELIVGAAVISVLDPIDGLAIDEQGQSVTLPVGAYRLDVLDFDESTQPIGLLMSDESSPYFVPLVVSEIVGQLIDGAPVEEDALDIVIDGMSFKICSKTGDLEACGNPAANKHKKQVHLCGNG